MEVRRITMHNNWNNLKRIRLPSNLIPSPDNKNSDHN